MKYERDWARQESSRRRSEDGPRELCRSAFTSRFDRIDTPGCEKNDSEIMQRYVSLTPFLMTLAEQILSLH